MIINSLLDNDLYKFTMMQAVLHRFPDTMVEYEFISRSDVDLRPYVGKIWTEINSLENLNFTAIELYYLSRIRFMKSDFIECLRHFKLNPRRHVTVSTVANNGLSIKIKGPWLQTILFEVPILAIISEIYHKENPGSIDSSEKNLASIAQNIAKCEKNIQISDFGTRRRGSYQMQKNMIEQFSDKGLLMGTSNVHFAYHFGLKPIGTMAHEWIQAGQGLDRVQLKHSQQFMLEEWIKEYRGDLGIALTDTISTKAFLKDFDLYLAKLYDGCRHDSGDPIEWGEAIIKHYESLRIDPKSKKLVFSDGLNIDNAKKILNHFSDRIGVSFGIGTHLTNYSGVKPLSIVIKLVNVNGNPVAKLSNNPEKTVCKDEGFLKYLKSVYEI